MNLFDNYLTSKTSPLDLFQLIELIGIGSTCKVYKAISRKTNKIYSIKVCNEIEKNFETIINEITLFRLFKNKNSYIVKFYGIYYLNEDNTIWIILEYFEYGNIISYLNKINYKPNEELLATIIQNVLFGLLFLHSQNIIHRDIKSQNLLLSSEGRIKISDFGISINKNNIDSNIIVGSPYWMSPEVIIRDEYNEKTDIYSLGITIYELVEGLPPYSEFKPAIAMKKIIQNPIKSLKKGNNYSNEFNDFVKLCLKVDFNERPNICQLLDHKFIKKSGSVKLLKSFIEDNNYYFYNNNNSISENNKSCDNEYMELNNYNNNYNYNNNNNNNNNNENNNNNNNNDNNKNNDNENNNNNEEEEINDSVIIHDNDNTIIINENNSKKQILNYKEILKYDSNYSNLEFVDYESTSNISYNTDNLNPHK